MSRRMVQSWMRSAWADRDTWPHVRIEIHLLPWDWRWRPWVDGSIEPAVEGRAGSADVWARWLFLTVSFGCNRPVWTSERLRPEAVTR